MPPRALHHNLNAETSRVALCYDLLCKLARHEIRYCFVPFSHDVCQFSFMVRYSADVKLSMANLQRLIDRDIA